MEAPRYCVFLFPSMSHVMKAEKILKAGEVVYKVIPIPRQISSDCGVCLRVEAEQKDAVSGLLDGRVTWEQAVTL
ncbi:MAG: DUF3343 domain-containing protein [Syntrophaceae bacterium]|nr:DUF3343 domain-containing protein [Syntrophaceae bacterium]